MPVSRDGCVRVCAVRNEGKASVTAGCLAGSERTGRVDRPDREQVSRERDLESNISRAEGVDEREPNELSPQLPELQHPKARRFQLRSTGPQPGRVPARGGSVISIQTAAAHQPATFAGVAQSVEHLFCKQKVRGSSPLPSSSNARPESTRPEPQLARAQINPRQISDI